LGWWNQAVLQYLATFAPKTDSLLVVRDVHAVEPEVLDDQVLVVKVGGLANALRGTLVFALGTAANQRHCIWHVSHSGVAFFGVSLV
jgi:hypothetical protein